MDEYSCWKVLPSDKDREPEEDPFAFYGFDDETKPSDGTLTITNSRTEIWVPVHVAVPRFPDVVSVVDEDGEEMLGRFINGQWWDEWGRTKLLGYVTKWKMVIKEENHEHED